MANIREFEEWLIQRTIFLSDLEENAEYDYGMLCDSTSGWASPGKILVLDQAIRCRTGDEQYLEIGTYTGRSLAGALLLNDALAQVIDPFGLFLPDGDHIQSEWEKTLKTYDVRNRITLHKTLCQDFQANLPPIGVFYYDGNHDSGHTYEGLKRFEKYLSPQAIVIVDDYMIWGGDAQTPYPGHSTVLSNPVQVDVDRWLEETKDRTKLLTILPWENKSAVILYEN